MLLSRDYGENKHTRKSFGLTIFIWPCGILGKPFSLSKNINVYKSIYLVLFGVRYVLFKV